LGKERSREGIIGSENGKETNLDVGCNRGNTVENDKERGGKPVGEDRGALTIKGQEERKRISENCENLENTLQGGRKTNKKKQSIPAALNA